MLRPETFYGGSCASFRWTPTECNVSRAVKSRKPQAGEGGGKVSVIDGYVHTDISVISRENSDPGTGLGSAVVLPGEVLKWWKIEMCVACHWEISFPQSYSQPANASPSQIPQLLLKIASGCLVWGCIWFSPWVMQHFFRSLSPLGCNLSLQHQCNWRNTGPNVLSKHPTPFSNFSHAASLPPCFLCPSFVQLWDCLFGLCCQTVKRFDCWHNHILRPHIYPRGSTGTDPADPSRPRPGSRNPERGLRPLEAFTVHSVKHRARSDGMENCQMHNRGNHLERGRGSDGAERSTTRPDDCDDIYVVTYTVCVLVQRTRGHRY